MTGELAKALAAFQAEAPTVPKSKTAKVPTKSGSSYSYSYADLADVAEVAYPILSQHGLSFSCAPDLLDGRAVLRGQLLHASGESIVGLLPLQGSTAQEIGSALTYARRYLLGCLTGIVTDADDDGALASAAKRQPSRQLAPHAASDADRQHRAMFATLREVGLTERAEILREVGAVVGREIQSSNDLTPAEVSKVIDHFKGIGGPPHADC